MPSRSHHAISFSRQKPASPRNRIFTARPALANARYHRLQLLHRIGRRIDIGTPQARAQQMLSAKHVQRQIAVIVVIAVIEAPFLLAVQDIVGGIQIQNDPFGSLLRAPPQTDPPARHRCSPDPPRSSWSPACPESFCRRAAVVVRRRQLQAVERALAGQGFAAVLRRAADVRPSHRPCRSATASMGSRRSSSWSLRSS